MATQNPIEQEGADALPELTEDFKVPDEPLAGVVQDDAKLFTVSIRLRREGVVQIPGISPSFFDPREEENQCQRAISGNSPSRTPSRS
jgi:hypothetical protein